MTKSFKEEDEENTERDDGTNIDAVDRNMESRLLTESRKAAEDEELIRLALQRNSHFTCMDEEQILRFIEAAELREFTPGTAIILEGCRDAHDCNESEILDDESYSMLDSDALIDYEISTRQHQTLIDHDASMEIHIESSVNSEDIVEVKANGIAHNASIDEEEVHSARSPRNVDTTEGDSGDSPPDNIGQPENAETPKSLKRTSQAANQEPTQRLESFPTVPPPSSGHPSLLYVIRHGKADVYYGSLNPASLGRGTLFGEGGFLFERQHSASIVAASPLECWVVEYSTFKTKILPSEGQQKTFAESATKADEKGDLYMTIDDFIHSYFDKKNDKKESKEEPPDHEDNSVANTLRHFLGGSTKNPFDRDNRVYLADFCLFRLLMARPDPEIDIVFLLMDKHSNGAISRDDFVDYLLANLPFFDTESEFVERHFGQGQVIRLYKFSQFLNELKKEIGKQAFLAKSKHRRESGSKGAGGYLSPVEFIEVLKNSCGWKLPDGVVKRLESLYCTDPVQSGEATAAASIRSGTLEGYGSAQVKDYSARSVSAEIENRENKLGTLYFAYQDFTAFQDVLGQLRGICNLIERACQTKAGPVSPDDLKVANRVLGYCGELSRAQVDIIFQLFDLDRDGFISTEDALSVCDISLDRLQTFTGREGKATFAPPPSHASSIDEDLHAEFPVSNDIRREEPVLGSFFEALTQFLVASASGAIGVTLVYPLDLAKTRMMNQRAGIGGKLRYSQSMDCLRKAVLQEGILGLYKGLLPTCLAVGPEKYIKFAVTDLLRSLWGRETGDGKSLHWSIEAICGGCAGACQLLITNPLEIIKIRLQQQGETAALCSERGLPKPPTLRFAETARELGVSGLYKGASACLLRDIPFGAIYFPLYSMCKEYFAYHGSESGNVAASHILLAGTLAGIPAALLTTPADVVKTRLQVIPRLGESSYSGTRDCVLKIYKKEGPTAFFKGSLFRVCRIAPQFGISLLCYEMISEYIGFQGSPKPPTNAYVNASDYSAAFPSRTIARNAHDSEALVQKLGLGSRSWR